MDPQGHVVVTDFGLAKTFESHEEVHRTLCGTDCYMAPEMVARRSYGKAVDVWSLGVLIFEMVSGKTPFSAKDTKELHRKILTEKVKFPTFLDSSTVSVLRGLLERQVPKRLGASKATMFQVGGFDALKAHAFFKRIEWQPLARRESPAPLLSSSSAQQKSVADLIQNTSSSNKQGGVLLSGDDDLLLENETNASQSSTVLDFEFLRDGSFDHVAQDGPLSPTSSQCGDVASSYPSSDASVSRPKKPRPPRKRKKKNGAPALSSPSSDNNATANTSNALSTRLASIPDSPHAQPLLENTAAPPALAIEPPALRPPPLPSLHGTP
mmetsp:Transcript_21890/g.67371  ORF Transcript_21890/g.67371 Transcript_21890/m.67371 type:complete len:324 (-) Transcript_21890:87-1058(-)